MGKGDKRSKRGKIILGSYGNNRPKADNKKTAA
jgi:ribosomal small subunit protein bTHX